MKNNRVVWSEGLFLRPQLFQQQERYLESFAHQRASIMTPYYWGFSRYTLDTQALEYGKLIVTSAQGIFTDGTPFDLPLNGNLPAPLSLQPQHCDQILYLALPLSLESHDETLFAEPQTPSLARYAATEHLLHDRNAIHREPRTILLSQMRVKLLPESELNDAWIGLPVARLKGLEANGRALLVDEDFIPPLIDFRASKRLTGWIAHVVEQLKNRAESLFIQLSESELKAVQANQTEDYLLLQIFNQYQQLLGHWLQRPLTHPETLFCELLRLNAELTTYLRSHRRLPLQYNYQHKQLAASFRPLIDEITHQLTHSVARAGEIIELQPQATGTWTTTPLKSELKYYQSLVLTVNAAVPQQQLAKQFLQQVKISAPQQLHDLVRSHLPGLALQTLPVPPRHVPHRPGTLYFELVRNGRDWQHILNEQALALHIAGNFPELLLGLWGLREI